MPTQPQKNQAIQYITNLLEASSMYHINNATDRSLSCTENSWVSSQPKSIELLLANCYAPITDFTSQYRKNQQSNIWTVPLLYKDQKTSFVRVADTSGWRADQSLKRYTFEQINEILHLRGIEKKVVELFGNSVSYYQPTTERLEESIRQFHLQPVQLDYSHIRPGDQGYGFVKNREAVDYKLPRETKRITTALAIEPISQNEYAKRAQVVKTEIMTNKLWTSMHGPTNEEIKAELRQTAQKAYPGLDPESAYKAYCGGEE